MARQQLPKILLGKRLWCSMVFEVSERHSGKERLPCLPKLTDCGLRRIAEKRGGKWEGGRCACVALELQRRNTETPPALDRARIVAFQVVRRNTETVTARATEKIVWPAARGLDAVQTGKQTPSVPVALSKGGWMTRNTRNVRRARQRATAGPETGDWTMLANDVCRCLDAGCSERERCLRWLERDSPGDRVSRCGSLKPYDEPIGDPCTLRIPPANEKTPRRKGKTPRGSSRS